MAKRVTAAELSLRGRGFSFGMVPIWVMRDENVSDAAFRLYALLTYYCASHGHAKIYVATLANELGKSRATIFRLLKELVEAGYVERVNTLNGANDYLVNFNPVRPDDAERYKKRGDENNGDVLSNGDEGDVSKMRRGGSQKCDGGGLKNETHYNSSFTDNNYNHSSDSETTNNHFVNPRASEVCADAQTGANAPENDRNSELSKPNPSQAKQNPVPSKPKKATTERPKAAVTVSAELMPTDFEQKALFDEIARALKGRGYARSPKRFATPQQAEAFREAVRVVGEERVCKLINGALTAGIVHLGKIIRYVEVSIRNPHSNRGNGKSNDGINLIDARELIEQGLL